MRILKEEIGAKVVLPCSTSAIHASFGLNKYGNFTSTAAHAAIVFVWAYRVYGEEEEEEEEEIEEVVFVVVVVRLLLCCCCCWWW